MELYLVRHGETEWNLLGKAQGTSDIPLDETGIKQAEELREKLEGIKFTACYSSPLSRARETAKIGLRDRYEIIIDELLTERSFGKLEGTDPRTWSEENVLDAVWSLDYTPDSNGIESVKSLLERAGKFLEKIRTEYPEDAKILIVAHNGILRALYWQAVGYDKNTNLREFKLKNGEMKKIEFKKG